MDRDLDQLLCISPSSEWQKVDSTGSKQARSLNLEKKQKPHLKPQTSSASMISGTRAPQIFKV